MTSLLREVVRSMAEDIASGRAESGDPAAVEADRPKLTPHGRGWFPKNGRLEPAWNRRHLRWKRTTRAQRGAGRLG